MAHLRELEILDLSNNHLEGHFPEWIHRISDLNILNLGQNSFTGDVPLVVGGRLNSLRDHFRPRTIESQFEADITEYASLRGKYMNFFRTHYQDLKDSKDSLWISNRLSSEVYKNYVNAYIEAEPIHLNSRLFTQIRSKPVEVITFLTEHQPSIHDINSQTKGRKAQS